MTDYNGDAIGSSKLGSDFMLTVISIDWLFSLMILHSKRLFIRTNTVNVNSCIQSLNKHVDFLRYR